MDETQERNVEESQAPDALTPTEGGLLKVMAASESPLLYSYVVAAEDENGNIPYSSLGELLIVASSSAPGCYAFLAGRVDVPLLPAPVSGALRRAVPILIGVLLGVSLLVSVGTALAGYWMASGVSAFIFFGALLPVLTTARRKKTESYASTLSSTR